MEDTEVTVTLVLQKKEGYAQFHIPGIQGDMAAYRFAANDVTPVACRGLFAGDASARAVDGSIRCTSLACAPEGASVQGFLPKSPGIGC